METSIVIFSEITQTEDYFLATSKPKAVIKNVIEAKRSEEINGENTLDFKAVLESKIASLITEDTILSVARNWGGYYEEFFDVAVITKDANDDGTYTIDVEADHISYRLNNPEYDFEAFKHQGTPDAIIKKILAGTGFFGHASTDAGDSLLFERNEKTSRRQLLMDFAAQTHTELEFKNFDIYLKEHIGYWDDSIIRRVMKDKEITTISKTVDKRTLDKDGNPTKTYTCDSSYEYANTFGLGDQIQLVHPPMGIDEKMRVTKITYNPYDESSTVLVFGPSKDITDAIYDGSTSGGGGDTNGTTISLDITQTGPFETIEWLHGFDTDKEYVQFLTTPQYYDFVGTIQLRDICIERTDNLHVRIRGYAEVL